MTSRMLGELSVSALGLGCMGMSQSYGTPDDAESIRTIHRALDIGVRLLDTADAYGRGANETLIGRAIAGRRDDAIVATKFGLVPNPEGGTATAVDAKPARVKSCCEDSLRRLGVDVIDLYYLHRIDPATPIEDVVGAMSLLVREGKVRFIGLSEAGPDTIRRAHAVHPVSALQSEYSLWSREVERAVLPVCEELGIGFVAYSPLGRGFFGGTITTESEWDPKDVRRHLPRFQGENLARNVALRDRMDTLARGKHCTASQLAIAWVLAKRPFVVPIPGTKRIRYLEENAQAAAVELTAADVAALDEMFPRGGAAGERYPPASMRLVETESSS